MIAIDDPAWFPDRIDVANRLVRLVPTTRETLAGAAFLDGRTPIARPGDRAAVRPVADFARLAPSPIRWILHESFCGSTLLARMTADAGRAFVLREPHALVDCANRPDPEIVAAVRALLARRWHADEPVVVKPSNWINVALPALVAPEDRIVTVTIAADAFVIAVLRGGRDRIAYTLRLYQAFARARPDLADRVARAIPPTGDAITTASGLVAALHWMQRRALDALATARRIAFPEFLDGPEAAAAAVRDALGILPAGDATATMAMHSKVADRPADRSAEADANAAIRRLHVPAIEAAARFRDRLAMLDAADADGRAAP